MAYELGAAAISGGLGLVGGLMGQDSSRRSEQKNAELQREFAKNGIRWKVADAKAAGIHPMYAMGASGASASPVSVGDNSLGHSLQGMGQDISRAMTATKTQEEREFQQAQLANLKADTAEKLSNAARNSGSQVGPAFPGGLVTPKPMEVIRSAPDASHSEPAPVVDQGWLKTSTGWAPAPSNDAKQKTEDSWADTAWAVRNLLIPNVGLGKHPPKSITGGETEWDPTYQEYRLKKPRRSKATYDAINKNFKSKRTGEFDWYRRTQAGRR